MGRFFYAVNVKNYHVLHFIHGIAGILSISVEIEKGLSSE